jgi:quercetin dioxygenase-like cupin family protein
MHVTKLADARHYEALKHFGMTCLRLQGLEASEADFAWVGLSYFLPGGGADMDAGAVGKIYVVLEGEVTIELAKGERHILSKLDSCFIPAGEARAIRNTTPATATMLVVMPNRKGPA